MKKIKTLILIICCSLAIGCTPSYEDEKEVVMDYGEEIITYSIDHGTYLMVSSSVSSLKSYATSEIKKGEAILEKIDKKKIHDLNLSKAKEKYREALAIELEALEYLEYGSNEKYSEKSSKVSDIFGEGTDYLSK